jgi:hypothetical protein
VLWSVALGNPLGSVLNSPLPSWTPVLCELVLKVNSKFKVRQRKKRTFSLPSPRFSLFYYFFWLRAESYFCATQDLDVFARNDIEDELASLDPLLRNVGGWDVPSGTYELDPS